MDTKNITDLRPHPANATIYGDGVDAGFVDNIKTVGILTPLLVATDGRIVSGHRRWCAAKEAGLDTVPVTTFASTDEDDIVEALVLSNRDSRQRTNEQLGREIRALEEIASRRLKHAGRPGALFRHDRSIRKDTGINYPSTSWIISAPVVPHRLTCSMDIAAALVGVSNFKGYQLVDSVNAIDHLTAEGKHAEAQTVRVALEKSATHGKKAAVQCAPESVKRRSIRTKRPLADLEKELNKPRKNRPKGNYEKAVFYFGHLTHSEKVRFFDMMRTDLARPAPKRVAPADKPGVPEFQVNKTVH